MSLKNPLEYFEIQTGHLISVRQPQQSITKNKNKKRTCQIVDLAVPAD